jgi:DNA primase
VLTRELAAAQQRSMRQAADFARRCDTLEATQMQLRAQLVARDTALAQLQERHDHLAAGVPQLASRLALTQQVQQQAQRLQALQRDLQAAQRTATATTTTQGAHPPAPTEQPPLPLAQQEPLDSLREQSVLCVGGRPASVPLYRLVVERQGARFLHHDGGAEESAARLDATLAAADLVLCQTGCISHDAYWRVKDHCKRTGKRCVFVESPSRAALERALAVVAQAEPRAHPQGHGSPQPLIGSPS